MAKKRIRLIVGIAAAAVAVIVVGLLILLLSLGTVVQKGFSAAGPRLMGVETRLDDADIGVFSGKVDLKGLHVGNPEGFSAPSFVRADRIQVHADVLALFKKRVHVREVIITEPQFTFEYKLDGSNVGAILERLESKEKEEEEKPEEKKKKKQMVIDLIQVKDARIKVVAGGQQLATFTLGTIEIKDIGKDKDGSSPVEVVQRVLGGIVPAAEKLIEGSPISDAVEGLAGGLKEGVEIGADGIEKIGKGVIGAAEEAGKGVGSAIEGTGKGLKGITDSIIGGGESGDDEDTEESE